MFFTRIGKAIAYVGSGLCVLRLAMAVHVAGIADFEASQAAARRYLGTSTSGEAIDRAIVYLLIAISIGILCEISTNIKRASGH